MIWWETISTTFTGISNVTARAPTIRSNWWYLLPIFLGLIGGVIAWFALKSNDRRLGKTCLILGIVLVLIEALGLVGLVFYSENLNLITEFETISETSDLDFQFKIDTP